MYGALGTVMAYLMLAGLTHSLAATGVGEISGSLGHQYRRMAYEIVGRSAGEARRADVDADEIVSRLVPPGEDRSRELAEFEQDASVPRSEDPGQSRTVLREHFKRMEGLSRYVSARLCGR